MAEVAAGAEGFAAAGEDEAADGGVGGDGAQAGGQFVDKLAVQGVVHLRPVQGEGRHPALAVQENGFIGHWADLLSFFNLRLPRLLSSGLPGLFIFIE